MRKLHQIRIKVQHTFLPIIPFRLHKRFLFGIESISLKRFESLNANGRGTANNRNTGESRMYRLMHDERFLELIPKAVTALINRSAGELRLSLDFSKVGPLQIACLAVTTGKGRALPVWIKVYFSKPRRGTMIPKLIRGLEKFILNVDSVTRINICMDRWFASPELLKFLHGSGLTFIVRVKSGLHVGVPWEEEPIPVGEISAEDTICIYAGMRLRLVRSNLRAGMKEDEPWFLLTNDWEMSRQMILNRYAKRFEIEEFFKDLKWIQGYEWHRIKTKKVLETVLWFMILGWWILKEVFWGEVLLSRSRQINPKKRLSFFRHIWEKFHLAVSVEGFKLVDT